MDSTPLANAEICVVLKSNEGLERVFTTQSVHQKVNYAVG